MFFFATALWWLRPCTPSSASEDAWEEPPESGGEEEHGEGEESAEESLGEGEDRVDDYCEGGESEGKQSSFTASFSGSEQGRPSQSGAGESLCTDPPDMQQ